MPQSIAFAPAFAAPRHPPLWNGEGIGAATQVATPSGPLAAGQLRAGARVLGGGGRQLVLTALRHVTLPRAAFRRLGLPPAVRIAAGALGPDLPNAPLILGPAQRIRLAGDWIAADRLVDGHHVTRLDDDIAMVLASHGETAPLLAAGTVLAPAGAILPPPDPRAQAAILLRQIAAAGGTLDGFVDHADRRTVRGWARDTATPDRIVPLEAAIDGQVIATTLADQPRPDLARPDNPNPRQGFTLRFPQPLPPHRTWLVTLRRAGNGPTLPGTPILLDATHATPTRFDTALATLPDTAEAKRFLAGLLGGGR